MTGFSFAAFKICSLFAFCKSGYNVSWCGVFFTSLYLEFNELLKCLYSCLSTNLLSFQSLFLQTFSPSTPPSQIPTVCMLVHVMVSRRSLRLCSLFLGLFCCCCSSNSVISSILSSGSLILLPAQICLSITLVNFSFQLLYFSDPEFLFGLFLDFLSLYWYFHCVHTSFLLFPHLPLFLWASFKVSTKSAMKSPSDTVYFFPLNGSYFSISLNALWFFCQTLDIWIQ